MAWKGHVANAMISTCTEFLVETRDSSTRAQTNTRAALSTRGVLGLSPRRMCYIEPELRVFLRADKFQKEPAD